MKYSILIVAIECHYTHVSRFIRHLKEENPEAVIDLLTNYDKSKIEPGVLACVERVIKCPLPSGDNALNKLLKVFKIRKPIKELSKTAKYDVINIHFPHYYMAGTLRYFRKMSDAIVVSPWGSDILRVNGIRQKMLFGGVLKKCDVITATVEGNIGQTILSILPNAKSKFCPQVWGSETIDFINEHFSEYNTDSAKRHFDILGRYVITCGYNAFRAQNHMKIIDSIVEIRNSLPQNLLLLFPVSYGSDNKEHYVRVLKERCKQENLDALFIEDYLSVQNVCILRMATDMFVHVQNTDASCASLQEYVLCNKKIVHGGWISYPMLEAFPPLCYHVTPDFSSLGKTIIETYHSEPIAFSQDVLNYIRSGGWIEASKGWNAMFEKIAQGNRNTAEVFVP